MTNLKQYLDSLDSPYLIQYYEFFIQKFNILKENKENYAISLISYIESNRVNPDKLKINDIIFNVSNFEFHKVENINEYNSIFLSKGNSDYFITKNYINTNNNFSTPRIIINSRFIYFTDTFPFSTDNIRNKTLPSEKKLLDLKIKTLITQQQ